MLHFPQASWYTKGLNFANALRKGGCDRLKNERGPEPGPERRGLRGPVAKLTDNEHFAYDSYRRFIPMFSDVVMEIKKQVRGRAGRVQGAKRREVRP